MHTTGRQAPDHIRYWSVSEQARQTRKENPAKENYELAKAKKAPEAPDEARDRSGGASAGQAAGTQRRTDTCSQSLVKCAVSLTRRSFLAAQAT